MIDKTRILEDMKTILEIEEDNKLNIYIQDAIDFVINYCNIPSTDDATAEENIPDTLQNTIRKLAIIFYRKEQNEHVKKDVVDIPDEILKQLNTHKRVVII